MAALGVTAAIMRDGQILLTKREDFEVWCLPGGHVDPGESIAQAAIREAREETGLEVRLTRLVGVYSVLNAPSGEMHVVSFVAEPVGGALQPGAAEVLEARYFDLAALPEPLLWWHRQRILDAVNGVSGVAWLQVMNRAAQPMPRQELYALRDRSGLSRHEFYRQHFEPPGDERREVGG